jgi:hypothetical protein
VRTLYDRRNGTIIMRAINAEIGRVATTRVELAELAVLIHARASPVATVFGRGPANWRNDLNRLSKYGRANKPDWYDRRILGR